ncbi:hypothetical protein CHGG_00394 [Chaetomium globosum CBS 148.51]|uniref:Uncharacterized protein n=1 Tax=Chaetomium globosum (strain ATCC 6205 / CBS 148.51 / DSM 1962 / NBRC 6347 / NRRL 1970) TaxID=306901 RepID=Q2HHB0_CHAGB|nr:uncharacterized protein CHGG_00394 [Chaetomium globosum CBS 148.51]EAQ92159.1 hypothetical protein CHGG_00394 [Chaetomium globosum CBS 148.51]
MDHHPIRAQTQPQPRSERWAPEIYVHLEFRVSWGGKKQQQQPPKNHQITFRSRGPRERSPAFPRQVPAPNTNYLAAIHNFDQRQARARENRQNNPHRHHQMQEYYQGEQPRELHLQQQQQRQQPRQPRQQPRQQPRTHLEVPVIQEPERPTRADTRSSSHERGRSAPPPIGENPWDVNIPHLQARNSEMPPSERNPAEIRRKPLPAPPSQFRLGDGGQPWSTWSLPDGYDPDTHPKDEEDYGDYDTYESIPVISEPGDRNSTTYATNPTMVSTFSPEPAFVAAEPTITISPEPSSSSAPVRDVETGRAKELGALSAAMMTVDNGFETQWWNQGRRDTVFSNNSATDDPTTPDESPIHRWSSTAAMSSTAHPVEARLPAGVVSPLTDAAFSPAQVPASLLQRTLSTRSEELWFRERGH